MMRTQTITDKQIVEDLLQYFNNHPGYIDTDNDIYNYKKIRKAIINCLKQAMEDGYAKCLNEAISQAEMDFDKTLISGKKDW